MSTFSRAVASTIPSPDDIQLPPAMPAAIFSMPATTIPNLRSPYAKVGRIVYFGRMLDKIRLHAAGKLPADYISNLGDATPGMFDARCCAFLGIKHAALTAQVLATGATPAADENLLAWACAHGTPRTDHDCLMWNHYMRKLGWRDETSARLQKRIAEYGAHLAGKNVETFFDLFDADEGRAPAIE